MSMPSRPSFSDDSRMIKMKKPLPKSMLLRDYLLDDMSSCSSNGFRSYPRRQFCTTVRFHVETDLNRTGSKLPSKRHRRSLLESNLKPKQSSVLQKASAVMIRAFKRLPFAGAGISGKANLLPRSLSRKLLKHGFWKKTDHDVHNKEVKRLKSFGDLLMEKEISPPTSPSRFSTAVTTLELRSSMSNGNSDFTATTEGFTNGNDSEGNLARNEVAVDLPENKKTTNGEGVGTTATANATYYSDSTENAKKWQDKNDEQYSPVSVMDFPDVGEDDEVSSVPPHKLLDVKGTKLSARKTRVSDRVYELEPIKLEDRIAQLVDESSTIIFLDFGQEDSQIEKKAMALLQLMKSADSSRYPLEYEVVETVLLGFFKENALQENVSDYEMLQRAKDWMDGQELDMFIDWECDNNRQTYLRDMEKGAKWSNYDHQLEKVSVGLEVECEIFDLLVNDVLLEFR